MTKFSFEPESKEEKMKEEKRNRRIFQSSGSVHWEIALFLWFLIGIAIGIGLLNALGLWPESLAF